MRKSILLDMSGIQALKPIKVSFMQVYPLSLNPSILLIIIILQHHSPATQIHITVNGTKLPRRRGKSNVPYVFFARGRVHLSPRQLPHPPFSHSIIHMLSTSPAGPSTPTKGTKELGSKFLSPKYDGNYSNCNLEEAELSGTNAEGDVDSDQYRGSAVMSFDASHPYFGCQQSFLRRPKRKRFPVLAIAKKRILMSPEIIYVEDSDEETSRISSVEDDDEWKEAPECLINPNHWNETHYAFGRYFLSFMDPKGRSYAHVEDGYFEDKVSYDPFDDDEDSESKEEEEDSMRCHVEDESDEEDGVAVSSTPDLTTSSYRTSSSLPPSSPPAQMTSSSPTCHLYPSEDIDEPYFASPASIDPLSLSPDSSLELHPIIVASHYPNKKYTATPAPPKARKHRLRLERLERMLEKVKRGKYLCACDEDVEDKTQEEEVDELCDESCVDDDSEEGGKTGKKWVTPSLKKGEEWDPFGDEVEL